MSKIKNGGLDQYGAGPFEQQQLGTAGIVGVTYLHNVTSAHSKAAVVSYIGLYLTGSANTFTFMHLFSVLMPVAGNR